MGFRARVILPIARVRIFFLTVQGDITKIQHENIQGADILSAGPPCIPFAGNGLHEGEESVYFEAFLATLSLIVCLVKSSPHLLAALLENVFGALHWTGTDKQVPPIFFRVMMVLRAEVSEFHWGMDKLFGQHYKLGASRRRAFLKGIRKECVSCSTRCATTAGATWSWFSS